MCKLFKIQRNGHIVYSDDKNKFSIVSEDIKIILNLDLCLSKLIDYNYYPTKYNTTHSNINSISVVDLKPEIDQIVMSEFCCTKVILQNGSKTSAVLMNVEKMHTSANNHHAYYIL